MMRVAIVGGTAGLGWGLAVRLATAGADVLIGSRTQEKGVAAADNAAERTGKEVKGGGSTEVVTDADLVVITVPFTGHAGICKSIKDQLVKDVPVLDCTAPLASDIGGKPTRVVSLWQGSAAQQAKEILETNPVASGFHTVMADVLEDPSSQIGDVLVCGDMPARKAVRSMVEMLGSARFVDCGPLEQSRILETVPALLIGLNIRYKLHPGAGVKITNLPD
jgi:hypothetical protein